MSVRITPITSSDYIRALENGQEPDEYYSPNPVLYRIDSVGFVAGEYRPCWKCQQTIREFAIGVHLIPSEDYQYDIWSLIPVAHFDQAGFFTTEFKAFLKQWYCIDYRFSKTMNQRYLALTCNRCGALQGDNFIFNDFNGQGGNFVRPDFPLQPVHWLDLPPLSDNNYHPYVFLFTDLSVVIPVQRVIREGALSIPPHVRVWTKPLY
ncbi:hypothetical protein QP096_05115 [Alloscardovia omnicolens]|uniref:Uncharacterized protein n=1 Tax=Alloscardovia omnicolens F0580 TaxID=1321816 RepID=U1R7U4_9BIFI|nr:hypothetical protein [Alloscardovia omnicolens]ERH29629.1 hypothetical protein HMPREF9244_01692 [Alloscardovia omnicolens F0580]MDK6251375.1 hypothetical protein [Alloscardovia omnicolens]PKY78139.1 hypothetical protein CYJ33_07445 [Alloscardovia omnicolens]